MKYHELMDQRMDIQLEESTISRFRKYLAEIGNIQPLAVPVILSWWDK